MMRKTCVAFSTAVLLSVAGLAQAQITLDGWTSFNSTTENFSGSFDASASDKIVIVATGEHGFNNTNGDLVDVQYDGVSLIKAVERQAQFDDTDTIYADIWYLDSPNSIHTQGIIDVSAITRANITVLGLSGTEDGIGNFGVTPTDTRSISLQTSADSFVVASFAMGGAGNTANVNDVTANSPLSQIAALENGSNWDGQVVGYQNNTTAGTQNYSFTGGNTDGSLVIAAEFLLGPPPPLLTLNVNTLTGAMTLLGDQDESNAITYYEISSAGNSLTTASWNSLADQDYEQNGPADGSGNGWEETGGSGSATLAEAYLLGNSEIAAGTEISLGTAYDTVIDAQDLTFRYLLDNGKIFDGDVEYIASPFGDLDRDGDVDDEDIDLLIANFTGSTTTGNMQLHNGDFDGDGDIDNSDVGLALGNYTGPLAPLVMSTGLASAVPEPSSLFLLAGAGLLLSRRRPRS